MIQAITVTNPRNESLRLELDNPWVSGLAIRSVDGLGPAKADIKATDYPVLDGSLVTGVRLTNRQIIFDLIFLDDPPVRTIEDCRQITYKFFPIKKPVTILVETDNRAVEATGYVEESLPEIWSDQEGATISIVCSDPYFYAARLSEQAFSGVEPMFEFPFCNDSLDEPLLEMGNLRTDTNAYMTYIGDADTGMTINIRAYGQAEDIGIYNFDTNEYMKISTGKIQNLTGSPFDINDEITINTKRGEKSISLRQKGKTYNIVSALEKGSTWLQLTPGDNAFYYSAKYGDNNLMVTFAWRNAYGGI